MVTAHGSGQPQKQSYGTCNAGSKEPVLSFLLVRVRLPEGHHHVRSLTGGNFDQHVYTAEKTDAQEVSQRVLLKVNRRKQVIGELS